MKEGASSARNKEGAWPRGVRSSPAESAGGGQQPEHQAPAADTQEEDSVALPTSTSPSAFSLPLSLPPPPPTGTTSSQHQPQESPGNMDTQAEPGQDTDVTTKQREMMEGWERFPGPDSVTQALKTKTQKRKRRLRAQKSKNSMAETSRVCSDPGREPSLLDSQDC